MILMLLAQGSPLENHWTGTRPSFLHFVCNKTVTRRCVLHGGIWVRAVQKSSWNSDGRREPQVGIQSDSLASTEKNELWV